MLEFQGKLSTRQCTVLIDSGASANFVSAEFVEKHKLKSQQTANSYTISMADGKSYSTNQQCRLKLRINDYYDWIVLIVAPKLSSPLDAVLGIKWLEDTNPYIDWTQRTVQFKHRNQMHCFRPRIQQNILNNKTLPTQSESIQQLIKPIQLNSLA